MARLGLLGFIIYLIFGIYQLNFALNFVSLPTFSTTVNNWIIFIGGILIIIGGINYLRVGNRRYPTRTF